MTKRELTTEEAQKVACANELIEEAYTTLSEVFNAPMPVGQVRWVHVSQVQANDYNPNAVAGPEMTLLHTSITQDGLTQPIVTIFDEELGKFVVVDGYHRYTVMRRYADVHEKTGGYLPVVVIDKPISDRIASTVRHNRARGKHSVQGMGNLVFQMLANGETDETICEKIGVDVEELVRLKHVTGYSALYRDREYGKASLTDAQMKAKAEYRKEHPDERILAV